VPGPPQELQWHGVTLRDTYASWVQEKRDKLADAARDGRWDEVLRLLEHDTALVNAARPGGTSGFALLHQVGYVGAPATVVAELLRCGAWRTLRTFASERPVDIAAKRPHPAWLVELLAPEVRTAVAPSALAALELHFHATIRWRAESQVREHRLRLPQLETLTEMPLGQRVTFTVPGMYGAFSYHLERGGDDPMLAASSWSRVVEGPDDRYVVTCAGFTRVPWKTHPA